METEKTLHPLMTVQEASERLRLTKNTLNNWLSQGRIKRVKIGRRTFIARQEVENLLNSALRGEVSKNSRQPVKVRQEGRGIFGLVVDNNPISPSGRQTVRVAGVLYQENRMWKRIRRCRLQQRIYEGS